MLINGNKVQMTEIRSILMSMSSGGEVSCCSGLGSGDDVLDSSAIPPSDSSSDARSLMKDVVLKLPVLSPKNVIKILIQ